MLNDDIIAKLNEIVIEKTNNNELKELTEISIDHSASIDKRLQSYLEQIINPYCFLVNGTPVQIKFSQNKTLDECLYNYFIDKKCLEENNL